MLSTLFSPVELVDLLKYQHLKKKFFLKKAETKIKRIKHFIEVDLDWKTPLEFSYTWGIL